MSASEFGGTDFALGTVRGFRRWKVEVEGILTGVSHTSDWMPGENVAECKAHPTAAQVEKKREDEEHDAYYQRVAAWKAEHDYAACAHGFYAYFDGRDERVYSGSTPCVSGVIDGYGEVLIGSKGFRATKARIVALSVAPHMGLWRLEKFVTDRILANYPGVPIFDSELAMRAEYPAPVYIAADPAPDGLADRSIATMRTALANGTHE